MMTDAPEKQHFVSLLCSDAYSEYFFDLMANNTFKSDKDLKTVYWKDVFGQLVSKGKGW